MMGGVGIVNKKERFAGAVLVLTLAVGVLVDVLGRQAGSPTSQPGGGTGPELVGNATVACDSATDITGEAPAGYRGLDINRATPRELMLLPGIGPKKAEAIVAWRDANGPFPTVEGLLEVKGIGESTLRRLRPFVTVDK